MFDFERLEVYSKAKTFNTSIQKFLINSKIDSAIRNQLRRCAISIVLNIAEGSGRYTNADKKNFFIISRGSVFESVAVLDILKNEGTLSVELFKSFYGYAEELSKMLFAMIHKLEKPKD